MASSGAVIPPPEHSTTTPEPVEIQHELHIPNDIWFRLLQDVGTEMTPTEFDLFAANDQKTKAYCIAFGGYFYRDLYALSEKVYNSIDNKRILPLDCAIDSFD